MYDGETGYETSPYMSAKVQYYEFIGIYITLLIGIYITLLIEIYITLLITLTFTIIFALYSTSAA